MKNRSKKTWIYTGTVVLIGLLFLATIIDNYRHQDSGYNQEEFMDVEYISPHYKEYSDQNLETAKANGETVLFFAATTWCTTCSALDDELKQRSATLPDSITVLKVDYDLDSDMKRKYNATVQHTMVHLDSNGEEITRWIGGGFDTLVQQIQ